MSGCPNCRAYVCDGEMFCRACGFRLAGFQLSTQNISFPSTPRVPVLARSTYDSETSTASWRRHVMPIMGFLLAISIGSATTSFFNSEPVGSQVFADVPKLESVITNSHERSYMGVYLIYEGDQESGALIDRIVEASPAELAGLHSGDRIISVNSEDIFAPSDVLNKLSTIDPGSTINLKIQRDDTELNVNLNTVDRSQLQLDQICTHQGFLGVSDLHSSYEESDDVPMGVEVGDVLENSPAQAAGLQQGDVIQAVNNAIVTNPGDLSRHIRANHSGDTVELDILRNDDPMTLTVTLGSHQ